MSNKEAAFYMIPASSMFLALMVGESCYDAGKLWIPIVLMAITVVMTLAKKLKKKTPAKKEPHAGVDFYNHNISRAYYSTGRR